MNDLGESMIRLTPGDRLKSVVCTTEVVVVRAPEQLTAELSCGGVPMVPHDDPHERTESIKDGYDHGTVLGKRYGLGDDPLEVLVIKAGAGALSLGDTLLDVKGAKPLPSSD
jgi:hypothetical protein